MKYSFLSVFKWHIIQEKVAKYGDVENGVDMTSKRLLAKLCVTR